MYEKFAQVYDSLMEDVNYELWVDYIEEIFNRFYIKPIKIIDLACGTGNITIPLSKRGYHITGIDLSADMLTIAEHKSQEGSNNIQWIQGDMINLKGFKQIDTIICACDGINYILEKENLNQIFKNIYDTLGENGIFTFDINSSYKISRILADETFAYSGEEVSYIWENFYDSNSKIIDFELSFFVREGKHYNRFNETHQQRAYSIEEIIFSLENSGFKEIFTYETFGFKSPKTESERIQFVCKKR